MKAKEKENKREMIKAGEHDGKQSSEEMREK